MQDSSPSSFPPPFTMSAAALIAKLSEADMGAVSGIANDVAAAVASDGIAALETSSVMADLEVASYQLCDVLRLETSDSAIKVLLRYILFPIKAIQRK